MEISHKSEMLAPYVLKEDETWEVSDQNIAQCMHGAGSLEPLLLLPKILQGNDAIFYQAIQNHKCLFIKNVVFQI